MACLLLFFAIVPTLSFAATCFDGSSPFAAPEWQHCQVIREPDLLLYYSYDETEQNVRIGLHASQHSDGWSALALAGNGGMKGASQIVVRQVDGGEWVAEDRYSDDYATPVLDASQNVQLLFAQQQNGATSWGVTLMVNSCDDQDYPIEDYSRWMHWALGTSHEFTFHGNQRGQFHANLLAPPQPVSDPSLYPSIEFTMPNVTVELGPGGQDPTNPYICSLFNLQELLPLPFNATDKIHAVHLSPILDADSRPYVHHMLLYTCPNNLAQQHHSVIPECESMPPGCDQIKFVWAVGSQDIVLPDDVGLAFGQGQTALALQMHYYNPQLVPNIMDSSGVRVYLSPTLRDIDAGFMEFNGGTDPYNRPPIPAGVEEFALTPFVLPNACTSNWNGPVNILAVVHHMHLVGKEMRLEVERNGQYLGTLRREYAYDFTHQSLEPPSIATLLPGDQLNMFCTYDTSSRSVETTFGDLSQQEMCYGILLYYPQQEELESFGYSRPLSAEEVAPCTLPGTGDFAPVSRCAQYFVEELPAFFDVPVPSFTALDYCNGDAGPDELREYVSEICPLCYADQSCTVQDLTERGTLICQGRCQEAGVSLFPDESVTESPFDSGYWCGERFDALFTIPELASKGTCQPAGTLSVQIAPTSAPTSHSRDIQVSLFQLAMASLVMVGSLLV